MTDTAWWFVAMTFCIVIGFCAGHLRGQVVGARNIERRLFATMRYEDRRREKKDV